VLGARTWLAHIACLGLAALGLHATAAAPSVPQVVEQTTDPEYTVQFTITTPAAWPAGGEVRLLFDRTAAGDGYALVIDPQVCSFAKLEAGRASAIGKLGQHGAAGRLRCVLKRRQSRMTALVNGAVVATACDATYHQGAVAWTSTHDQLQVADIYVQPTAPVVFTDDFVHEGDSTEDWQTLTGAWHTVGPDSKSPRPDLSANPFSLKGACGDRDEFGLTAAGDWFWDDYRAEVAAKARGRGAIGVAAYVQDRDGFLLFRWTSTGGLVDGKPAGRRQLIRVRGGEWAVLVESPGGFRVDQWYRLSLCAADGWVEAGIDGKVIARARDGSFGQGRVGLFAQDVAEAYFDDVSVGTSRDFVDDFARDDLGWWRPTAGEWICRLGHLYGAVKGGAAAALIGEADWSRYEIAASVKPKAAGVVGLLAYRRADGWAYRFEWERSGRQALVLAGPDGEVVLAEANAPRDGNRFCRLALRAIDGRVAASVDDRTVLEAANVALTQGQAGLIAGDSTEACFDNVSVTFAPERPPEFRVTAQFTRESTMENWVDPSRQWRQADDQTLWYDMPLFGDYSLWLPPVDLSAAKGRLEIDVAAEPKREGAARLVLTADGPSLAAEAFVGGQSVAQAKVEAAGLARLRVARAGSCVSVWLGEKPVLAVMGDGFRGRRLGLRAEGLPLHAAETALSSPNLIDVTFAGAPTDWSPGFGVWQVTDRWPCAPGWSWFGGGGHQSPLLWSKDSFSGDQVVEFWAGLRMDMDGEPGYSHPSDLDATLCGDGDKLCSGYSFIMAGADNTKSMIMKGNQVVAENPQVKFENPVSMNFAFHRHWFDIRIEKTGNHFRYTVDDQLVAEWTDPDPIAGGKVAFWSWNNGLLIARARVAAERVTR